MIDFWDFESRARRYCERNGRDPDEWSSDGDDEGPRWYLVANRMELAALRACETEGRA